MKKEQSPISFAYTWYFFSGSAIHSCEFFSIILKAIMTNPDLLEECKFKNDSIKRQN